MRTVPLSGGTCPFVPQIVAAQGEDAADDRSQEVECLGPRAAPRAGVEGVEPAFQRLRRRCVGMAGNGRDVACLLIEGQFVCFSQVGRRVGSDFETSRAELDGLVCWIGGFC